MAPQLLHINIEELTAHPDNPRINMRDDVIKSIATQIKHNGFSEAHAIHVRPFEGRYQIIAGHHRWKAAGTVGLETVPAWVEDLDDEDAFLQLVLSNMQGELTPLEIGIHVYKAVPLAKGGRGRIGGLSEYAARTSWSQPYLTQLRSAAHVFAETHCISSANDVGGKARHLYEISRVPEELWPSLTANMLSRAWSVAETSRQADALREFAELVPRNAWIPLESAIDAFFDSPARLTLSRLNGLLTAVQRVREWIDVTDDVTDEDSEEFENWLEINSGGDAWDKRAIEGRLRELVERVRGRRRQNARVAPPEAEAAGDAGPPPIEAQIQHGLDYIKNAYDKVPELTAAGWYLGRWQDHIDKLEDGEVALLLTDPPYGMNYRSNMRREKHEFITGDDESAAGGVQEMLEAFYPKLSANAHILVFCGWKGEPEMREAVLAAGFELRGSLIWDKQSQGMGDLEGSFGPAHERILHAVKGKPLLYKRISDVLSYARENADRHPTEKPTDLLEQLITVTTASSQLVADPFGGVASTCVAARDAGRRWWGSEMAENYWQVGDERILGP